MYNLKTNNCKNLNIVIKQKIYGGCFHIVVETVAHLRRCGPLAYFIKLSENDLSEVKYCLPSVCPQPIAHLVLDNRFCMISIFSYATTYGGEGFLHVGLYIFKDSSITSSGVLKIAICPCLTKKRA